MRYHPKSPSLKAVVDAWQAKIFNLRVYPKQENKPVSSPVQPARQRHRPVTGSQPSEFKQSHLSRQSKPNDPSWSKDTKTTVEISTVYAVLEQNVSASHCTHGTRQVTQLLSPARRARAGSIDRVARCLVGALACLVAVQSPRTTRAQDGAVHTLPTWTGDMDHQITAERMMWYQ